MKILKTSHMKGENMDNIIDAYRGNYIRKMRETVGHAPLMGTACGVIIENDIGEILLQQRRDNGKWGILGGAMEIGEKYDEVAKREVFEEAGIKVDNLYLFGIYSGEDRTIIYPNGDICCVTCVVFITQNYKGIILSDTEEAIKHCFFSNTNLPEDLNSFDKKYIQDWKNGWTGVIVD